ncbi:MAG: dienelactone hydrolase family protein, partial [Fimbriimonadaceae bacterium]|nr:dienelactone hydrolase family protein [Chitinophagales bacterium]
FSASDGKDVNAYFIKTKENTNKYLLVFHEWWGLNDYIKQMSDKLFIDIGNVNVIAVDLYDGNVATTKQEAQQYMQALDQKRVRAIMEGIKTKIGNDVNVATIGWCMGGGMSMQASLIMVEDAKGCVMYYGMPETDIEKIKTLNAQVLFIHASQDKWINDEVVNTFETNMKSADKKIKILRYDADHAFANPSNPKHNAEATKDAYDHVLKFLKGTLQ